MFFREDIASMFLHHFEIKYTPHYVNDHIVCI